MDHGRERMCLAELEEDLDYNISRKEELKKEVRKLKEQYESLHEVHLQNAKVAMDRNVENAQLKANIEKIRKESSNLTLENNELKDKVKTLDAEISELKKQTMIHKVLKT